MTMCNYTIRWEGGGGGSKEQYILYIFVPRCLNNFWCCLTQDKECNSKKGYLAVTSPWFALISSLSVLAEAEKTYSSFSFAVKKRFRKDVSSDQINNKSIKYRLCHCGHVASYRVSDDLMAWRAVRFSKQ